jgi:hypothetical protein
MPTFITKRYPNFGFRTAGGFRYRFTVGIFDTEQITDPTLREDAERALERLANDPLSDSGVMKEETVLKTSKFFACPICQKQFNSDAAVVGHQRIHKTTEKIEAETRAIGNSPNE